MFDVAKTDSLTFNGNYHNKKFYQLLTTVLHFLYISRVKLINSDWKDPFKTPLFKTNLGSFSLLNISIKFFNSFLYDDLYLSPYHFNSFYKNNYNLIKIFNVCLKSSNTWLKHFKQN